MFPHLEVITWVSEIPKHLIPSSLCIAWVQGQDVVPTPWQISNSSPTSSRVLGLWQVCPQGPWMPTLLPKVGSLFVWADSLSVCEASSYQGNNGQERPEIEIGPTFQPCCLCTSVCFCTELPTTPPHHPMERIGISLVSYHKIHYQYIWGKGKSEMYPRWWCILDDILSKVKDNTDQCLFGLCWWV